MKIGFVSTMEYLPWGGSEELWWLAAEQGLAQGHEVLCAVPRWPNCPPKLLKLQENGARLAFRRRLDGRFLGLLHRLVMCRTPRLSASLGKHRYGELRAFRPDVLCISMGYSYEFLRRPDLMAWAQNSSIPLVLVVQYADDNLVPATPAAQRQAAGMYQRANRLVFVSQRNLRDTQRQLALKLDQALVLNNPVKFNQWAVEPWPRDAEWSLASVARLHVRHKGHDILLEALSSPAWQARRWRLNLYGDGHDRDYLKRLATYFGLSARVHFHGHVEDVRSVWAHNHAFVLTSRGEGTPLALLEAMACGRPAIVTDVGGNSEWVEDGQTGFTASAASLGSVQLALERAWQKRHCWRSMGVEAHQTIRNRLDPAPGRSLLAVLLSAARGSGAPKPEGGWRPHKARTTSTFQSDQRAPVAAAAPFEFGNRPPGSARHSRNL